jgi:hypothetical protein
MADVIPVLYRFYTRMSLCTKNLRIVYYVVNGFISSDTTPIRSNSTSRLRLVSRSTSASNALDLVSTAFPAAGTTITSAPTRTIYTAGTSSYWAAAGPTKNDRKQPTNANTLCCHWSTKRKEKTLRCATVAPRHGCTAQHFDETIFTLLVGETMHSRCMQVHCPVHRACMVRRQRNGGYSDPLNKDNRAVRWVEPKQRNKGR